MISRKRMYSTSVMGSSNNTRQSECSASSPRASETDSMDRNSANKSMQGTCEPRAFSSFMCFSLRKTLISYIGRGRIAPPPPAVVHFVVVGEERCADVPLILLVLRVAGDHAAFLGRVFLVHADAGQVFTRHIGPHLLRRRLAVLLPHGTVSFSLLLLLAGTGKRPTSKCCLSLTLRQICHVIFNYMTIFFYS